MPFKSRVMPYCACKRLAIVSGGGLFAADPLLSWWADNWYLATALGYPGKHCGVAPPRAPLPTGHA